MVKVGVAIQLRAAKMVLACLPRPTAAEEALLHGADPTGEPQGEDQGGDGAHDVPAGRADGCLVSTGGPAVLGA